MTLEMIGNPEEELLSGRDLAKARIKKSSI